jgi:hypothetical protein
VVHGLARVLNRPRLLFAAGRKVVLRNSLDTIDCGIPAPRRAAPLAFAKSRLQARLRSEDMIQDLKAVLLVEQLGSRGIPSYSYV